MSQVTQNEFLSRILAGKPTEDDKAVIAQRFSVLAADCIHSIPGNSYSTLDTRSIVRAAQKLASKKLDLVTHSGSSENRVGIAALLLTTHPELVLPIGFDEVRYSSTWIEDPTLSEDAKGAIEEGIIEGAIEEGIIEKSKESTQPMPASADVIIATAIAKFTQYRTPGGTWHDMEGVLDRLVPSSGGSNKPFDYWFEGLASTWLKHVNRGSSTPVQSLTLPTLALPRTCGDSLLHVAARSTLLELQRGCLALEQLHWRTLEELVAELLRGLGLDVVVTPRSHDGGRDVIARGELIPGEPTLLAVEVKHRKTVPVSDLRAALWANRRFPALLFVTSGKFSAGIYREKSEHERCLRLFLKDGAGLTQWIEQYVRQGISRQR